MTRNMNDSKNLRFLRYFEIFCKIFKIIYDNLIKIQYPTFSSLLEQIYHVITS